MALRPWLRLHMPTSWHISCARNIQRARTLPWHPIQKTSCVLVPYFALPHILTICRRELADMGESEQVDSRTASKQVDWFLVVGVGLFLQYHPAFRHLHPCQLVLGMFHYCLACGDPFVTLLTDIRIRWFLVTMVPGLPRLFCGRFWCLTARYFCFLWIFLAHHHAMAHSISGRSDT